MRFSRLLSHFVSPREIARELARGVALLHGVFLDRLQWQRARHTLFTEWLESRWKDGWKTDFFFPADRPLNHMDFLGRPRHDACLAPPTARR
jgi:hypothetical protein